MDTPIIIIMHGICGHSLAYETFAYAKLFQSKGYICCVWNRRGNDWNTPLLKGKMTLFGYSNDFYQIITHIN